VTTGFLQEMEEVVLLANASFSPTERKPLFVPVNSAIYVVSYL
jgi:hypothetical protein